MRFSFTDIIEKLSTKEDLSEEEASFAIRSILGGQVSPEEIAAFLMGFRMKGQSVDELTTFVREMRDAAIPVEVGITNAVDPCGTGGDKSGTFNISTTAMFVAAGAGVPILKHGNRSVSSKSGSFDVLTELGAVADLNKEGVEKLFRETGMAFMFAPNFHPALKYVMPVRRALKIRTFFNMLGPLLNPAGVKRQVIGTFSLSAAEMMIGILKNLSADHVCTLYAEDGLDEMSPSAGTHLFEYSNLSKEVSRRIFHPNELGFPRHELSELKGGDARQNAAILKDILNNRSKEAMRDVVLMNAAYSIYVSGLADTPDIGVELARKSIDSGEANRKLELFVKESTRIASMKE